MNLVVSFIILVLSCFFANTDKTKKAYKIYVIIVTILLVLQNGLRNYTIEIEGNDTYNYFLWFNQMKKDTLLSVLKDFSFVAESYSERDFGFPILVKIIQLFTDDYRVFLILVAIFIVVPIARIIYKMSSSIMGMMVSFLVFESLFSGFFMTAIRQTIAMGLVLWSCDFIIEKKTLKFLIIVTIAYTIHASAILFAPIIIFQYISKQRKIIAGMLVIAPVLMVFAKQIIVFIGSGSIYEDYAIDSEHNLGTPVFSCLMFLIGILTYYNYNWFRLRMPQYYRLLIPAIGTAIMLVPSTWVDSNFIRVVFYYAIFIIPIVPICVDGITAKNESLRLPIYGLISMALLFLMAKQ